MFGFTIKGVCFTDILVYLRKSPFNAEYRLFQFIGSQIYFTLKYQFIYLDGNDIAFIWLVGHLTFINPLRKPKISRKGVGATLV